MLTSLALVFLVGLALAALCQKLKLPRIIGMLATGILLGPCVLNVLDGSILSISADLRKLAPHARTLVLCRGAFLFKRHKRNSPLGCALVFRRMLRAQRRKRLLRFFNVLLRGKIPLFEALPVRLRCTALFIDVFDIIPDLCAFKLRFLQLLLRLIHIV